MTPPAPFTGTLLAMDCLLMQVWRSMIDGGDRLPGAAGGEAAGKNELPPPASSSVAGDALPSRIRPGPPKGWGRRRCGPGIAAAGAAGTPRSGYGRPPDGPAVARRSPGMISVAG